MEGGPHVNPVMVPKPTLGDDHVMIQVAAIGLNSNNGLPVYDAVLRLFGRHGSHLYIWNECSGVVVAVGSKVSNFKEGDEIHGAAGGVGIISLQYARHVGCKVFAVAGTEEKLRVCKTMGVEVCINHKKEDFCKRVKAETGGKGVDIILDVNGGKYFRENLDCLAMGGSLVILGLKGGRIADFDISVLGEKDLTVVGADLLNLSFEGLGSLLSDVAAIFWPLINAGHITPIIGKTFNFSQVAEALVALRAYRFPGKLLMTSLEISIEETYFESCVAPILG